MAANKTQSKSDFIRSQPSTLSAAEVVAKAKAEGIKIDPALVYRVQGRTGAKRKARRFPRPSRPRPLGASRSRRPPSSAPSPRTCPSRRSSRRQEKGIRIADTYVYRARRSAKKKVTKAAAREDHRPDGPCGAEAHCHHVIGREPVKAVAAELGLGRAMEILAEERARVRAVIAG